MTAAERRRAKYLWDAFRITPQEWDRVFEHQGRVCAICKRGLRPGAHWHTDHHHKTGKVRGILCSQCNRALGKIEDPRWQWSYKEVYNASFYMDNPPASDALGRDVIGYPGKIGTKKFRKWVQKNK